MPQLRLKINPAATDDWLANLTTEFPNAEFRMLAGHPTDAGVLGILEIHTSDTDAIVRRFDTASEVRSFDVLHTAGGTVLIRSIIPLPKGYHANRRSGIPPKYPARMQDGWLHTVLTGSHDQLAEFVDVLTTAGIPYQIKSLTQSHEPDELLTERQQEFIMTAVKGGYYDSPRRCTLTELAETFDINKSAASGVLHRAEGRIIKDFVAESLPGRIQA